MRYEQGLCQRCGIPEKKPDEWGFCDQCYYCHKCKKNLINSADEDETLCDDCIYENINKCEEESYKKKNEERKRLKKENLIPKVFCISCKKQCDLDISYINNEKEYILVCENKKCGYKNQFFINKEYYKNLKKHDPYIMFTNSGLILHPTLPNEYLLEEDYKKELQNPSFIEKK